MTQVSDGKVENARPTRPAVIERQAKKLKFGTYWESLHGLSVRNV